MTPKVSPNLLYEAEVVPGLEDFAQAEIAACAQVISPIVPMSGSVRFRYDGTLTDLNRFRLVSAVYAVIHFAVPRPKALLGHQHFTRLCQQIALILKHGRFSSLYLSAAGSESSVMQRLKAELAIQFKLAIGQDEGDLWLRLRPAGDGWDMLIRLTPRPLVTRSWRVADMPGALNATVAHALALMTQPQPDDTCLNIGCGSGTILIERASMGAARYLIGCDYSQTALALAERNAAAAEMRADLWLLHSDARQLPLPAASISSLLADLPFGQLVGSHEANRTLYPALLAEAARVACPEALFALITHEIRLMTAVLDAQASWQVQAIRQITLRGLHPRLYLLQRR